MFRCLNPMQRSYFLNSEHPPALRKSIPYGQAESCSNLTKTFVKRGYAKEQVGNQAARAIIAPRLYLETKTSVNQIAYTSC